MVKNLSSCEQLFEEYKKLKISSPSSAERFYIKNIFWIVAENIAKNYKYLVENILESAPEVVVISVGYSWQPVAELTFAAKTVNAREEPFIIYIVTENSMVTVEKAKAVLAKKNVIIREGFNSKSIQISESGDPKEVIKALKKYGALDLVLEKKLVLFDITGGTKPMSSGLLAAAYIVSFLASKDFYVTYIASNFDHQIKEPIPGTEKLVLLTPIELFSDVILKRALMHMKLNDYEEAKNLLELVFRASTNVLDRSIYKMFIELCEAENFIESHSYAAARSNLSSVKEYLKLKDVSTRLNKILKINLAKHVSNYAKAIDIMAILDKMFNGSKNITEIAREKPEALCYLMADLLMHAERREAIGDKTLATIYYYRSLELAFQMILAYKYNIDPSKPDYNALCSQMKIDVNKLSEKFSSEYLSYLKSIGENGEKRSLPSKLGLLDMYILLKSLNDNFATLTNPKELREAGEARNTLLIIHGFKRMIPSGRDKSLQKLKKLSIRICEEATRIICYKKLSQLLHDIKRIEDFINMP